MQKPKTKTQFVLYMLIAFVVAVGVITIANLTIKGTKAFISFIENPLGDYLEVAKVNEPDMAPIRVVVFEIASQEIREMTAYNVGDPLQTDGSPCITADGTNACEALAQGEKLIATNDFPMDTYLFIPGYGILRTADRMNKRFEDRIDIAMQAHEKQEAIKFGLKHELVSILK